MKYSEVLNEMTESDVGHPTVEWVKCSDRIPTREDADDYMEVWWCGKEHVRRENIREILSWDFSQPWNINGYWAKTGMKIPKAPQQ